MPKIVFLDTNVYLHYQPFDQIKWPEIVKADTVTIVVPPVIVRELNKHKELHPRSRVKRRAGAVLKKLSQLFESGSQAHLRDGVDIWLEDRDPVIDFAACQLNHKIQDDNLIASIIICQTETPEAEVILITSDAGLALMAKANRQGIETTKLPDNLRLAEELDPDQKRIRELEQELRELKLQVPQLSLTFKDGSQHATFVLSSPVDLTREELENRLKEIKQRHPKMKEQSEQVRELPEHKVFTAIELATSLASRNFASPEDIVEYNKKLDEFYQAYVEYLQKGIWFQNLKRRTAKLSILVTNNGTVPAKDVDVFMHFPDGFNLINEQDFPEPLKPPQPPSKPKTQMQKLTESISGPRMAAPALTSYIPESISPPPNVSAPTIRRANSYDVSFYVQRIKHKLQEPVDALYVAFESFESAQSFHIDYRMLAANVPNEVTGKLHIIMRKE